MIFPDTFEHKIGFDHVRRDVRELCVSSLGESFVLLDADDRVLMPPMLYTDPRGEEEARELSEQFLLWD